MPPAAKERPTPTVSDAEREDTGATNVGNIETKKGPTKEKKETAVTKTEDKYILNKYFSTCNANHGAEGRYMAGNNNNKTTNVKGSLRRRIVKWKKLGATEFVLNTIRTGYKLPFLHHPKKAKFRNKQSALRNEEFVSTAIAELLESGRISKMKNPAVVNPLTVSEKGMKKRLILDLRHVNLYLG